MARRYVDPMDVQAAEDARSLNPVNTQEQKDAAAAKVRESLASPVITLLVPEDAAALLAGCEWVRGVCQWQRVVLCALTGGARLWLCVCGVVWCGVVVRADGTNDPGVADVPWHYA